VLSPLFPSSQEIFLFISRNFDEAHDQVGAGESTCTTAAVERENGDEFDDWETIIDNTVSFLISRYPTPTPSGAPVFQKQLSPSETSLNSSSAVLASEEGELR
jgi:hypothetical protein